MGLFADIWDWMKSKVKKLISSTVSDVKSWAKNKIKNAIDGIKQVTNIVKKYYDNSVTKITKKIYETYNTVKKYYDNTVTKITKKYYETINLVKQYITNVTKVFNEYVTNNTYQTVQHITNVIGVMDPTGFLKNPLGYIGTAFNNLINAWVHTLVGGLAKGLQIGLLGNPPEPEGPGASFKRGFNAVIDKEEE